MSPALSRGGRLFLGLGFVASLSGCESEEKKLARLENERTTQCLLEEAYREKVIAARFPTGVTASTAKNRPPITPEVDSLMRRWTEHKTKCDLATRDYNRSL